jgi:hypothetical protein
MGPRVQGLWGYAGRDLFFAFIFTCTFTLTLCACSLSLDLGCMFEDLNLLACVTGESIERYMYLLGLGLDSYLDRGKVEN